MLGRDCVGSRHPDVAFINLRFPSGVIAEVQISWLSPVKLRRTMVVGSRKMLVYDDTENVEKVKVFDHGVDFREPEDFGEFQLSYRTGDIVSPKLENLEPLYVEARHFLECGAHGRPADHRRRGRPAGRRLARGRRALAAQRRLRGADRERSTCARRALMQSRFGSRPRRARTSPSARAATCRRRASSASRRGAPARASCRSTIGAGAVIRPFTTIYAGSTFGARLQTGQGV